MTTFGASWYVDQIAKDEPSLVGNIRFPRFGGRNRRCLVKGRPKLRPGTPKRAFLLIRRQLGDITSHRQPSHLPGDLRSTRGKGLAYAKSPNRLVRAPLAGGAARHPLPTRRSSSLTDCRLHWVPRVPSGPARGAALRSPSAKRPPRAGDRRHHLRSSPHPPAPQ